MEESFPVTRSLSDRHHRSRSVYAVRVPSRSGRGYLATGPIPLPWEALVLRQIEKLAHDPDAEPLFPHGGVDLEPYPVELGDLKAIKAAFETVHDLGLPIFSDMRTRFKLISSARTAKDAPKNAAELKILREPLLLADMRI
ncbi:hypothetical protein F5Y04DRAFT_265919 [Hypomontagnella monticulosa]|nr:hypothetical protein F5Y04DRAFT_265919 [Hypomontagnella monticulosa]